MAVDQYDFHFINDDFTMRVINELVAGETIMAALNEEGLVLTLGYGNNLIRRKLRARSLYVVTPKRIKSLSELKNKKIITLKGTGQIYYLKKELKFTPVDTTLYQAQKVIAENFVLDNKSVDGVLLDENLALKLKGKNLFRIDGGFYYLVSIKKGDRLVWYNNINNALKKNDLVFTTLTVPDVKRVREVSRYIIATEKNKSEFTNNMIQLERFLINQERK